MKRLARAVLAGAALAGGLALGARDARAIERQHHLGLGPTLGILAVADKSTPSTGGGGTLHYAYGLSDQWNLVGELGGAAVALDQEQDAPDSPRTRPARALHGSAGVAYVVDILRWVPYLTAQAGAMHLSGGTLESARVLPDLQLGVGLDYQLSRSLAVGVAGRQHFLVTDMGTYPSYTTATLRLEYMWGW